jgi:hypothetical protein
MAGLDDIQLDRTPAPPSPTRGRVVPALIVSAVLSLALAGGWYYRHRTSGSDGAVAVQDQQVVANTAQPQDPAADLPPLDESDDLVRELVSALSRHPIVVALLTTDQLVRTFAVSVMNVAHGESPSAHLYTIKPDGKFQVRGGRRTNIAPGSYARFDGHAAAISGIDPEGAARLYTRLKPRIEEAYREVAGADASVDGALERAIAELLATPIVEGEVAVEPRTVGYGYADPSLESLSAAQKQLLRMGPANVRLVQQQLRAIARQLGIDDTKLPRERVISAR